MYNVDSTIRKGAQIAKNILARLVTDCNEQDIDIDSLFTWRGRPTFTYMVDEAHAALNLDGTDEDALTLYIIDDLTNGAALCDLWTHDMNEVLATIIEVNFDEWIEEV